MSDRVVIDVLQNEIRQREFDLIDETKAEDPVDTNNRSPEQKLSSHK